MVELFITFFEYCAENKAMAGFLGFTSLLGLVLAIYALKNDSATKQQKAVSKGKQSPAIVGNDATINYGVSKKPEGEASDD